MVDNVFHLLVPCGSFSNAKTKSLFTSWKIGSTKWFKFGFSGNNSAFDRYLFELIVLLKPEFNVGNNLASSYF